MKFFLLEGTYSEMGAYWGKLLSNSEDAKALLNYFISSPEKAAAHLAQSSSVKRKLLSFFLKFSLSFMSGKIRREDREFLNSFAKSLGISSSAFLRSFAACDFFNALLAVVSNVMGYAVPHVFMGCSSFVVFGSASRDGILYHGRNLDYPGGDLWEKAHSIVVMKPKNGIPSINITAAGAYIPGVTSINEKGLAISLHMNFTRDVNFNRTPILSIVSEVCEKARNLSDVADILKKRRPLSGWAIVVSSAEEKDAAVFELTADGFRLVYPENNRLCYTNMYFSDFSFYEYAPSYAWVENNVARYERLKNLLEEGYGNWEEHGLIKLLGDTFDVMKGNDVALGNTISNACNISSVLFCWEKDALWVADSFVPVNRGRFLKFSLSSLFSGKFEVLEEVEGNRLSEHKEKAFRYFCESCFVWERKLDILEALRLIDLAIEEDEEEPWYYLVRALYLVKLKDFEAAYKNLILAEMKGIFGRYKRCVVLLWKARVMDLMGKRKDALYLYKTLLEECPYMDLNRWAWKGIKKAYTVKAVEKLDVVPFLAEFTDLL